jgi:hypothetical protein
MAIDAATGALTWTPTEAQGPSTNTITVVVTDQNPAAPVNTQQSVTNAFRVIVTEQNTAPTLDPIGDRSLHFDTALAVTMVAADADLPAQNLTYALDQAPTGMSLSASGEVSWTPDESQVGIHAVTIRVSDNGPGTLSATTTFQVTVTGEGARLDITWLPGQPGLAEIAVTGDTGVTYELQATQDLVDWIKVTDFQLTAPPFRFIDPDSRSISLRFYRLRLIQP